MLAELKRSRALAFLPFEIGKIDNKAFVYPHYIPKVGWVIDT